MPPSALGVPRVCVCRFTQARLYTRSPSAWGAGAKSRAPRGAYIHGGGRSPAAACRRARGSRGPRPPRGSRRRRSKYSLSRAVPRSLPRYRRSRSVPWSRHGAPPRSATGLKAAPRRTPKPEPHRARTPPRPEGPPQAPWVSSTPTRTSGCMCAACSRERKSRCSLARTRRCTLERKRRCSLERTRTPRENNRRAHTPGCYPRAAVDCAQASRPTHRSIAHERRDPLTAEHGRARALPRHRHRPGRVQVRAARRSGHAHAASRHADAVCAHARRKLVREEAGNLIVAPATVYIALAMVAAGACRCLCLRAVPCGP